MVWGRRKWTCIVGGLELAGQHLWLCGVGGVAVCAVVDYWVYTEDEAESCTSHVPKPQQRQRSNEPQGLKLATSLYHGVEAYTTGVQSCSELFKDTLNSSEHSEHLIAFTDVCPCPACIIPYWQWGYASWNQFQPPTISCTTNDNWSVMVWLLVGQLPRKGQLVQVPVVAKMGLEPDLTGPDITSQLWICWYQMARAVHKCSNVGNSGLHRATGLRVATWVRNMWPPVLGTCHVQVAKAAHKCGMQGGMQGWQRCVAAKLLGAQANARPLGMLDKVWGCCTEPESIAESMLQRWGRAKSGALAKARANVIASGQEQEQGASRSEGEREQDLNE
ncbi:hypothetical protein EDB89DRAFT_1909693 [Lactarius sanguifluus]|nr:hypothetical protein EDB89DRAFT_1909693 [Lactarius sanguifluus]